MKNKSLKQLHKYLNLDFKNLTNCLKANKISRNTSKTELIIFHPPKKVINYDLTVKIDGKRFYHCHYVKYLGVIIDQYLNWSHHIDYILP